MGAAVHSTAPVSELQSYAGSNLQTGASSLPHFCLNTVIICVMWSVNKQLMGNSNKFIVAELLK